MKIKYPKPPDVMKPYCVGVTGSSTKITTAQKEKAIRTLKRFYDQGVKRMHNGDCIVADEFLGVTWLNMGGDVTLWPPIYASKRAYLNKQLPQDIQLGDNVRITVMDEQDYLVRNRSIVDSSYVLVALSDSFEEKLRSGTWATIRYAEKKPIRIIIIFPDGSTERRGPW